MAAPGQRRQERILKKEIEQVTSASFNDDDNPPGRNFVLVGKMLNALIGT